MAATPELREVERIQSVVRKFKDGTDGTECLCLIFAKDDVDAEDVAHLRGGGSVALVLCDISVCAKHEYVQNLFKSCANAEDLEKGPREWPGVVVFFRNEAKGRAWKSTWKVDQQKSSTLKVSNAICRILSQYNQRIVRPALVFSLHRNPRKKSEVGFRYFVIALKKLKDNCERERYFGALKTLKTFLSNLVSKPHEEKFRRVRVSNKTFQKRLASIPGGLACMHAIGFVEKDEGGTRYLKISLAENGGTGPSLPLLKRMLALLNNATA